MAYQLAKNGSLKIHDNDKENTSSQKVVMIPTAGERPQTETKLEDVANNKVGAKVAHAKMYK